MNNPDIEALVEKLSPTRPRALRQVADGDGHLLHGREASGLIHAGLIRRDGPDPVGWEIVEITDLGWQVLAHLEPGAP